MIDPAALQFVLCVLTGWLDRRERDAVAGLRGRGVGDALVWQGLETMLLCAGAELDGLRQIARFAPCVQIQAVLSTITSVDRAVRQLHDKVVVKEVAKEHGYVAVVCRVKGD